jgi:hypothetical protein
LVMFFDGIRCCSHPPRPQPGHRSASSRTAKPRAVMRRDPPCLRQRDEGLAS